MYLQLEEGILQYVALAAQKLYELAGVIEPWFSYSNLFLLILSFPYYH